MAQLVRRIGTGHSPCRAAQVLEGGDVGKLGNDATAFFGVAIYPKITFSETAALAFRGEYFSITKGHPLASPIGAENNAPNE